MKVLHVRSWYIYERASLLMTFEGHNWGSQDEHCQTKFATFGLYVRVNAKGLRKITISYENGYVRLHSMKSVWGVTKLTPIR